MTFVTGAFVTAGMVAMALPILIHLLSRQRRRPIEWAAMRFLLEAFRKHKRRLQLQQLILLATRCLILALFGLALARPLLEGAGVLDLGGTRTVWLVIDNGVASSARSDVEEQSALQRHIAQATGVLQGLRPGDAVGVITAARPAQIVLNPPSTDHSGVTGLLETLAPREAATDLSGAISLLAGLVNDDERAGVRQLAYIFSEFREGSAPLQSPVAARVGTDQTGASLFATEPAAETAANVQILSMDPVRNVVLAAQDEGLSSISVRLARQGQTLDRQISKVRLEGEAIARVEPRVVAWAEGQSEAEVEFPIRFAAGDDREVSVTARIDDDSLAADNQRFVVLDLRSRIRVLLVDRRSFGFEPSLDRLTPGQWMQRALEPAGDMEGGPIEVVQVEPAALALPDVRTADAAIVPRPDLLTENGWALLRSVADRGGLVLVCPPHASNVHNWTELFTDAFALPWTLAIETSSHELAPLMLADEQPATGLLRLLSSEVSELAKPVQVFRTLAVNASEGAGSTILELADGSPLLIAGTPGVVAPAQDRSGAVREQRSGAESEADAGATGVVLYLAAAPALTWTNLPTKPLMVPLMHEIVRQGLSEVRSSERLLVSDRPRLNLWPQAAAISSADAPAVLLNEQGRLAQPLERSGVYTVQDQVQQPLGLVAVNIDPRASVTTAQGREDVGGWLAGAGAWQWMAPEDGAAAHSAGDEGGAPIALYLLLAIMGLVAIEALLARRFSHAYKGGAISRGVLPTMHEQRAVAAAGQGGAA